MYELQKSNGRHLIGLRDEAGFVSLYATEDEQIARCALDILNDPSCSIGTRAEMGAAWVAHCSKHGLPLKSVRPFLDFMPRISAPPAAWR